MYIAKIQKRVSFLHMNVKTCSPNDFFWKLVEIKRRFRIQEFLGVRVLEKKKTWRKCKQHKKLVVLYTFLITTRRCLPSYTWMYACLSQMMIKGLAFLSYARLHFLTSLVSLMKRRREKIFSVCIYLRRWLYKRMRDWSAVWRKFIVNPKKS